MVVVMEVVTVWVTNAETVVGGGTGAVDTVVMVTVETLVVVIEVVTVWVTDTETVFGGENGTVTPSSMIRPRKLKLFPWPAGTFTTRSWVPPAKVYEAHNTFTQSSEGAPVK